MSYEIDTTVEDMKKEFPLDESEDNSRILLIWELQIERGNVLLKMKDPDYILFLIKKINEEKSSSESNSIQAEVIEYLFIAHKSYNKIFEPLLPHLDIEPIKGKIEFDMMIKKNMECIPDIISYFYSKEDLKRIYNSLPID